jgi:ketosteroid isomerase-like protein
MTEALAPARSDEAAIRSLIEGIAAGHRAKDAALIARHYVPNARIADLAPPLLRRGVDPSGLQAWLDGWAGPVEVSIRDLAVEVDGDLAIAYGLQRLATRTHGDEAAAWWSRITRVLVRTPAGWRITHEHDSVPFHMDGSFRAAVDLEP